MAEEVILEWAQKVSKKYVSKDISTQIHEKAKPFIQWLQEAEEEESSEEEDDSDLEIEYNDRATVLKKEIKVVPKEQKKVLEEDDGEDELNIDDI